MGGVKMQLKVTGIVGRRIICGPWEFSSRNGAELDDMLGWDEQQTGSMLIDK
jgi:hypothetical protein